MSVLKKVLEKISFFLQDSLHCKYLFFANPTTEYCSNIYQNDCWLNSIAMEYSFFFCFCFLFFFFIWNLTFNIYQVNLLWECMIFKLWVKNTARKEPPNKKWRERLIDIKNGGRAKSHVKNGGGVNPVLKIITC